MTMPLAIAPDGSTVAYAARADDGAPQLFIRRLDSFDTIAVPDSYAADVPFFSPDSRNVGFFSGGYIKRVSVTGGPPSNIAEASWLLGASWGRDGTIVYAPFASGSSRLGRRETITAPTMATSSRIEIASKGSR